MYTHVLATKLLSFRFYFFFFLIALYLNKSQLKNIIYYVFSCAELRDFACIVMIILGFKIQKRNLKSKIMIATIIEIFLNLKLLLILLYEKKGKFIYIFMNPNTFNSVNKKIIFNLDTHEKGSKLNKSI